MFGGATYAGQLGQACRVTLPLVADELELEEALELEELEPLELEAPELLELELLPPLPEGTEHSFTPPAIRPPKLVSLQTKDPLSTL
ncbi:MAG: hypothetical protein BSR46_13465 [Candidatus Dactylopiibacterium carminicum]|nr:MAG: hypothetical protein BSR46_13465 [Candidatus Dactylopiibacterium carminicum]